MNYLVNQKKKLTQEVQLRTTELKKTNLELAELNREVQSQNEELTSQNEHINIQQEELQDAQKKLEKANEHLEELVKQRTEKLEMTIKELDKTVFELDRFVYSASHDLSAPLKSILGLVHIAKLERDPKLASQYHEYIETSILKLETVIKNLVEYSRNSHLEILMQPFKFSTLVNDVIQELAFWPEALKVTITNNTDPTIQLISDEQRIKVILHNLIGNAIKYADLRKEIPFIKIDCTVHSTTCIIHIADNGIGIDERDQSKVFEMYYRATDRSQGSGLGLFIVKEITNKLRGTISVKSAKGKGTEFFIELPYNR
jgi:signal transduction histidine kinase